MISLGPLAAALAAGMLLGMLFFGGLWWTVRHGLTARHPALWFAGSTLARMAIVLAAFYNIAHTTLSNVLACLFGLLLARGAITLLTRASH